MRGRPNLYTDYSKESAIFSNNTQKVWFVIVVILAIILWVGWHVLTARSESDELDRLSRKRHGPNDHKSNVTEW